MTDNGRLVLIADDDEDIRMLVRTTLERAGCEVMAACDGVEALELARIRMPDLAVLDVSMPELDGLEALRRLRANEEIAAVPVLLLSARAQETDVECGLEAGASGYIVKPFSPRELIDRVDELLSRG